MKIFIAVVSAIIISICMPDNFSTNNSSPEMQDQKPLFSFGLVSDIQYCDCDSAGTRYFRSSLVKLEEAVRSFRIDSPAFIINLGDMIEKDFASYKPLYRIIDTAGIRFYHVTGNHDYSVEPRQKKRIPPLQSNKEGYYSFIYDQYRFIILNGNELSTYATTSKTIVRDVNDYILKLQNDGEINGLDWNGGVSSKQLLWFGTQLKTAKENNEKVFIMCHFPVFPENEHNLLNYIDVLTILKGYDNVIAWFSGHNHAGNYGNFNMIHFVTMKGMVETEKVNSFALIEVYKNKIWIKGSGREKSQILAI
jgi:manganese-dependent ADP-ribose/CDP-alcohol diphosphatase